MTLLRTCSRQLSPVYFKLSKRCITEHIPSLWKAAVIVPILKKSVPKELNDYRPIALTSVPFKCFERIILKHLKEETDHILDDNQFAYRKHKCTEDATIALSHAVLNHLEATNTYARALFIDFSSACNTILPSVLI